MFGTHEDLSSQTGSGPATRWVTPDGCFINQWHPNKNKFAVCVAVGGDVDPTGDDNIESVTILVIEPSGLNTPYQLTKQELSQPGWFLGPHGSPVSAETEPMKFWGWCVELDLTSFEEGELQVAASVGMRSGQGAVAVPTYLKIYNNSVGTVNIRPNNSQVFIDEINGNDSNNGYNAGAPVQTLTAAINKARWANGQSGAAVVQVMTDITNCSAAPSSWWTDGQWPLTFRSYNGRHKFIGGGTWTGVDTQGARVVFEGFDFVDGGIEIDSATDSPRTLVAVGCHSYPSWWQNETSVRSLAETWQTLGGNGTNVNCQYFYCQHMGTLNGPISDMAWDCKVSSVLGTAVKTKGATWTLGGLDLTGPGATPTGVIAHTSTLVSNLVRAGIIRVEYQSFDPERDPDFVDTISSLVGLTDVGIKLSGFTTSNGTWLVSSVGRLDTGVPYVELLANISPSGDTGTGIETAVAATGDTWTTLAIRTAVQLGAATTEGVIQSVNVKPGFLVGFDQNGQTMDRVKMWNIGLDTASMDLDAAVTSCLLANLSVRGDLNLPGAVSWADSCIVDSVFSEVASGTWPTAAFSIANHFETGSSYGQSATTGPYFAAEGLDSVAGTRGRARGFVDSYENWGPVTGGEPSVSSWVLD